MKYKNEVEARSEVTKSKNGERKKLVSS